jgi:hypothetical protein
VVSLGVSCWLCETSLLEQRTHALHSWSRHHLSYSSFDECKSVSNQVLAVGIVCVTRVVVLCVSREWVSQNLRIAEPVCQAPALLEGKGTVGKAAIFV